MAIGRTHGTLHVPMSLVQFWKTVRFIINIAISCRFAGKLEPTYFPVPAGLAGSVETAHERAVRLP